MEGQFGEPWECDENSNIITIGSDGNTAEFGFNRDAMRATNCVNACDGMDNPQKEIESLQKRIAELERQLLTARNDALEEAANYFRDNVLLVIDKYQDAVALHKRWDSQYNCSIETYNLIMRSVDSIRKLKEQA
jgi:hypothetical protein